MEPVLPADLSRRDRERLARREAMLDAALAVFSEKGYNGTAIEEVAERAEFGKGTIYNYFPGGKDELYLTLFQERVVAGLHRVAERSFPEGTDLSTPAAVREAFRTFIHGLFLHFEESQGAFLLFLKEGHQTLLDPQTMAHLAGQFVAVIEAVARPLAVAAESGAVRPFPPKSVAHVIMGNVRGYLMAQVAAACDPSGLFEASPFGTSGEAADFITTVLFDGLLAPAASPDA